MYNYILTYIHKYGQTCKQIYIQTYMHFACMCTYMHTYMHADSDQHKCALSFSHTHNSYAICNKHIHVCTCMYIICVRVHACMHGRMDVRPSVRSSVCLSVCVYVCTYVCTCAYVCLHASIACMDGWIEGGREGGMDVCMYSCARMHICRKRDWESKSELLC